MITFCNGQIIDTPRPQPVSLTSLSSSTSDCCKYINNNTTSNDNLLNCTISKSLINNKASKIKIVSYYTDDIKPYAAYSFGINNAWAHYNRYSFSMLSPSTGHEFDSNDQRWNKVMILLHAIDINAKKYCKNNDKICVKNAGWAKDVDYIVWLDADLVYILPLLLSLFL